MNREDLVLYFLLLWCDYSLCGDSLPVCDAGRRRREDGPKLPVVGGCARP